MLEIKRGKEHVSKTFRLPVDLVDSLNRLAGENNISLNNLVVQCLQYAISDINPSQADSPSKGA